MASPLQELLNDAPSLLLRLAETSGTAAADATGGASGTYVGGVTLGGAGLVLPSTDPAPAFDGRSGYVSVADRANLDVGDTWTYELLVLLTAYADNTAVPATFIDKGTNAAIVRISNAVDGSWIVRRNGVSTLVTSTARIPLNSVTHIVATKSGSTVRQYQNAIDVTGTVTNATMTSTALDLGIGAADVSTGANGFFPGRIAYAAVYPTALSAARVTAHYAALASRLLTV